MLRWKRKIIGVKSEGAYGVDAVPTGAANALKVRNVTLRDLEAEYEERDVDTGSSGHKGEFVAGMYVGLDYEVELAGQGAAAQIPRYGTILKAAACSETVIPGPDPDPRVVYAPVHPGQEVSMSQYLWIDGKLHKVIGSLANVRLNWPRGRVAFMSVSTMGLFTSPSDIAVPVPTYGQPDPVSVNLVNTTPFTLHGFAGKFGDVSVDFGNALKYRNLPNSEAIRLIDRKSTGSVRLEKETVALKDWYTIVKNMTPGALAITHGLVAGNKVVFNAAQVQLTRPSTSQEDNIAMQAMNMNLKPTDAGNDEWSLAVK